MNSAEKMKVMQLTNDLKAAKVREEHHRADELKLIDRINGLESRVRLSDGVVQQLMQERDEWKAAFQTVSRLVK